MKRARSAVIGVGLGVAILYLGAQALTGRQGLLAYVDLQAREHALEARLSQLETERVGLRARADRLDPRHVDRDYLEEQARLTLAAGDKDEVVFALDQ
jgi:cell division protein FtsB